MTPATVQAFVAQHHAPDDTLYLLIDLSADCASDDPLHIEALHQTLGREAITPLLRPDLMHTPLACPVLVTLAEPGRSPSQQLLALSALRAKEDFFRHKRYVCGWLSSGANAQTVSAHVIALGQLTQGQTCTYFPVHEPLRLELLVATYRRNEPGPWWPVRHWLLPTSSGDSGMLTGIPDQGSAPDERAYAIQQDVPMVSALLSSWRRALQVPLTYAPDRWNGPTALPPLAAAKAYMQIRQARTLGLAQQPDLLTLALFHLMLHPRLHEHAGVRSVIKQAVQEQRPLSTLFALFNDSAWRQVVEDLFYAGACP